MGQIYVQETGFLSLGKMQKHIHLDGEKKVSPTFFFLITLCINYEYIIWKHLYV